MLLKWEWEVIMHHLHPHYGLWHFCPTNPPTGASVVAHQTNPLYDAGTLYEH